ncbi:MAG: hypothetical protein MUC38_07540 [Cyclobacteriaceae bacterium]|jgi:hypothetical protein|nr:hypothetical protein [Cyclobacteriaceae bacterium]
MLENIRLIFLLLAWASSFLLLLGLFKPWVVLWWEDTQHRMKVLNVYGVLCAVSWVVYGVMGVV